MVSKRDLVNVDKWEKTGLLSRLSVVEAMKMAELLERTAKDAFPDQHHPTDWPHMQVRNIILPLVRRVYAQVDYNLHIEGSMVTVGTFTTEELLGDQQFMCGLDVEVEICDQLSQRIVAWLNERGTVTVGSIPLRIEALGDEDSITSYTVSVELCPFV